MLDQSLSPILFVPSSSKGVSIHGDNAPEEYGGGRDEGRDGMQDDLEMEGSGDEDESVEGRDEYVGVFMHGRSRGHPPRNRRFNHHWRATRHD